MWGRGTLDDKAGVVAILEAVERLAARASTAAHGVVAFGHDEEVGGDQGAGAITERLADSGVRAWFSLDEGLAIAAGTVKGVDIPVATIGVAEKGYASVRLRARGDGGHRRCRRAAP